jgi:hypothetical protein
MSLEKRISLVNVLGSIHILVKKVTDDDPTLCHEFPEGLPLYAIPFQGQIKDVNCARCTRIYIDANLRLIGGESNALHNHSNTDNTSGIATDASAYYPACAASCRCQDCEEEDDDLQQRIAGGDEVNADRATSDKKPA